MEHTRRLGEKHHQSRHRASSSSLLPEQAIPTSLSTTTDEALAAADAENHVGLCQPVDQNVEEKAAPTSTKSFTEESCTPCTHRIRRPLQKKWHRCQPARPKTRSSDFTTSQRDTAQTVGDEGHAATRLHSPPSSLPHSSQRHQSTQDIVSRCQPRCCVRPAHGRAHKNHHLQDNAPKRGSDEDRRRRPTLHKQGPGLHPKRMSRVEENRGAPRRPLTRENGVHGRRVVGLSPGALETLQPHAAGPRRGDPQHRQPARPLSQTHRARRRRNHHAWPSNLPDLAQTVQAAAAALRTSHGGHGALGHADHAGPTFRGRCPGFRAAATGSHAAAPSTTPACRPHGQAGAVPTRSGHESPGSATTPKPGVPGAAAQ